MLQNEIPTSHISYIKYYRLFIATDITIKIIKMSIYLDLPPIISGVSQGSELGQTKYLIYTADLPVSEMTTTAAFVNYNAVLASYTNIIFRTHILHL